MIVLTVEHKKYPVTVYKTIVGLLDPAKCSRKFLDLNLPPDQYVYVRCDDKGNTILRGKKQRYTLYPLSGNKMLSFKHIEV